MAGTTYRASTTAFKAGSTGIVTAIAGIVAAAVCKALDVDNSEYVAGVTAVLVAAFTALANWLKHRKA